MTNPMFDKPPITIAIQTATYLSFSTKIDLKEWYK